MSTFTANMKLKSYAWWSRQ